VSDISQSNPDKKYISKTEHEELKKRCSPQIGDILYSKNGTIGIAKLVDWNYEFSIFVSLALLQPKKQLIDSKFLELTMNSENIQAQARNHSKTGTVTNLHLVEIKRFSIPLPSLEIQRNVVKICEAERGLILNSKNIIKLFEEKIQTRIAKVWGE
jgi:Restriction endonuclease S subunits